MEMASAFTLNVRLDNVAVVTIDVPGEKMNTLKAEFASQVRAILKQIRDNKALRGVVFISAKPDNFIAGADINMIGSCRSAQEAETPRFMAHASAVAWRWRWRATTVFVPMMLKPYWVYRKYSLACCPAPVVRSGCHA